MGACAIVIAPSVVLPPHPSVERAITLVVESQPVIGSATGHGTHGLLAGHESSESTLDYGVALALWAGRFLPIPGAALYHFSVAYDTFVDPMADSLVHNLDAFVGGDIELAAALHNIAVDAVDAVVDFATTELKGHAAVIPPTDSPNAGVEPWVRWIITAAVSPLYYLPVPNALTVDQISIMGRLVGTMVSSAIDNLGQVASQGMTLNNALSNLWAALKEVAIPELVAQERALFFPPAAPAGGLIGPDTALASRMASIGAFEPSSAADAAVTMAVVPTLPAQEEHLVSANPVPATAEPVDVDAAPVAATAEPVDVDAAPVAVTAEPVEVASAAAGVDAGPVAVIARTVELEPKPATGGVASTGNQAPETLGESPSTDEAVPGRTEVEHESPSRAGDPSPEKVQRIPTRSVAEGTEAPTGAKANSTHPRKPTTDRPEAAGEATKTDTGEGHGTDVSATQHEAAA